MVDPQANQNQAKAEPAPCGPDEGDVRSLQWCKDLSMLAALLCDAPAAQVLVSAGVSPVELARHGQVDPEMNAIAELPLPFSVGSTRTCLKVFAATPGPLQSEQKAALEALVRLAFEHGEHWAGSRTQAVGQAAGRAVFDRWLQDEWLRHGRRKESLSLLLIAVAKGAEAPVQSSVFGVSQDTEAVLRLIGESLRGSDLLAEYTAGSWAALLPTSGLNAAMAAAQRIRQALERYNRAEKSSWMFHIGVAAMVPTQELQARQLEDRARQALVQAQRSGSGRIEAFRGW